MLQAEIWLPIPGWEGLYEVSDQGRVYALERRVPRDFQGRTRIQRGCLLKWGMRGRYPCVTLCRDGQTRRFSVHHLVLEAFVGPRPVGADGLHWDDNPMNAAADNLRWGTGSDNSADMLRNRPDYRRSGSPAANAAKTHCDRGHEFTEENTRYRPDTGSRVCRRCHNEKTLAAYHAAKPPPAERPCGACGTPFTPQTEKGLYCSRACCARAYRARREAA